MDRREFIAAASAAMVGSGMNAAAATSPAPLKPMAVGLLISPFGAPEERLKRVHDLGFTNCFL
jgi:L-ribulose-5-phosphate 3-epimerase